MHRRASFMIYCLHASSIYTEHIESVKINLPVFGCVAQTATVSFVLKPSGKPDVSVWHVCTFAVKWHIQSRASTTAGCRDLNPPPLFVVVQLRDGSIIGATDLSKAYLTILENNLSCTRVLCIHIKPQGSCSNNPLRVLFCTTVYQRNEMLGRTLQQKHGLSLETELKPQMYELKRSWLLK